MAISFAILGYLIFKDLPALRRQASEIVWMYFGASLLCAAASYTMMGLALWEILSLLGFSCPFVEIMGITFVSSTANYLVSSAGISGFALKAHLLRKRQVPYGITVTASVLSTALVYFVLAVIILQGLVYLIVHQQGSKLVVLEGVVGIAVLAVTSIPLIVFFFMHKLRGRLTQWLFHIVNFVVYAFSKREIPRRDFEEFERQLNEGLDLIRQKKGRLTLAIVYTCMDWAFAIGVLYFGLQAVRWTLPIGYLSTCFAVGQAATLIPFLPGGLGAVEGAMTTLLESLGVLWEDALIAVLLYRVAYYILPGLCSIFLMWGLKMSEPKLLEDEEDAA